ncbi:hypothetical protein B0I35DRAFT_260327 [Stachybotrys elegans]|uniref:Outer membrane protein, beta-barrel n=1 Tax=Stachybotrys elegans TaxID=80388 RepID=A0A8K0ST22_9HYPO|nr:hypothetical protein B0I35DRAFT_260327 [Stachybotrys elegans]
MATQIQTVSILPASSITVTPGAAPSTAVPATAPVPPFHADTGAWVSMDSDSFHDAPPSETTANSFTHSHSHTNSLSHSRSHSQSQYNPQSPGSAESSAADVHGKSVEEACKRSLHHFPSPSLNFPMPTLEFDFRIAVKLKPEPSLVEGKANKEITTISAGRWSGSFGTGNVVAGGYDLGQARGFRPIRIVEGAFVMQTMDQPPAVLEMRTRGSLSGPSDILDALLNPRQPKEIDHRQYGFRMFSTIKTADKRYAEIVNCGLWVASGVWRDDELIIDAYRVA